MKKNILRNIGFLVSALLFGVAVFVIHTKLRKYHYHDIAHQLLKMPVGILILAACPPEKLHLDEKVEPKPIKNL